MAAPAFRHLFAALLITSVSAAKTNSFLAAKHAHRRAAEERLRSSASSLAAALADHLRYRPLLEVGVPRLPALAEDARDLLRHQASQPDAWDNANLLGDYAAWAPDYVMVVPFANARMDAGPVTSEVLDEAPPMDSSNKPIGHSISESTYVQSDGDHTLSESTKCKDGDCKTTRSRTPGSNLGARESSPLHSAMKQMTQHMADFSDNFGHDSLHDSLDSIFHEAHGSARSPETFGSSGSWGSWFPAMPKMPSMRMPSMRMPSMDGKDSIFKSASSQSSNSESMSRNTKIVNGKMVTEQKICKNGHCKTVVTTEDA